MKLAFYQPHLCVRGTTVAIFDYAYYNEVVLKNESVILFDGDESDKRNDSTAIKRFKENFPILKIGNLSNLDITLKDNKFDAVYILKGGKKDGIISRTCKNLIHCTSTPGPDQKHGERYAYVSQWLSDYCSGGTLPYVPHIVVDTIKNNESLHNYLNIPKNSTVFGRTGGMDTWDIPWANNCVVNTLNNREDVYFIFQNTPQFIIHPRVFYLPTTADLRFKNSFINTCSAMLHCRYVGESFGLSCGEFSIRNKRVITYFDSPERTHISILGDKGLYYNNQETLNRILLNFKEEPEKNWNCYDQFNPIDVMNQFKKVFLDE